MLSQASELGVWIVPLLLLLAIAVVGWLWLVSRPRVALAVLMIGLPFHTVIFQVASVHAPALVVTMCRLWREALLLALGVALIRRWRSVRQQLSSSWPTFVALGLYGTTLAIGMWRAESLRAALAALRMATVPLIIFAIALCLPYDLLELRKLVPLLLAAAVFVSLFALCQGFIWGPSFLWRYYEQGGSLPSSFEVGGSPVQRLMGTFASPNQLALYLVYMVMLVATLFMERKRGPMWLLGIGALFFLVLALTVSRSGWAALVAGGFVMVMLWWHRWELWAVLVALFALGAGAMVRRGLWGRLQDLGSLREVSAAYHVAQGWENLQSVWQIPLGAGLGSAGALGRVAAASGLVETRYPTESFLLQIGLQQGIQGMVAFGVLVGVVAVSMRRSLDAVRQPFARAVALAALASLAGAMVHAVMNVDLQDVAVQSYLWFLVAMGLRMPALEVAEREGAEGV